MKNICINILYNYLWLFSILVLVEVAIGNTEETQENNGGESKNKVIELTAESFDQAVSENSYFIMFYAPWCGHCKRLHPTWDQLGETHNDESGTVILGKVDCTQHTALCASHDVNGYPTLKLFIKGSDGGTKYKGQRDLQALSKYIANQFHLEYAETDGVVPNEETTIFEHTEETFIKTIGSGNHFVKFYAPWCGHCQRLAPTWEALAKSFSFEKGVTISKLDCTKYKSICTEYEVKGYPTLLWIVDGKKVSKYSGDRSHEDLKVFVHEQLTDSEIPAVVQHIVPNSPVVVLTAENFENALSKGITLVEYFAPWCGHCKRLSPTYDELGKKFLDTEAVTISKVDCTQDVNKELCSQQQVNGFPTLYLYKEGSKVAEYNGDRSLEDMVTFVTTWLSHEEL